MLEVQCTPGWFKFPVHTHFIDAEDALGVTSLDLFDCFDHRLDLMVLVHQIRDKLNVMYECDKERYAVDKHEIRG